MLHKNDRNFYELSFVPILFQVYSTLHKYRNKFTHYDLHCLNIVITKIPGFYFEYNFLINKRRQTVTITCEYIAKILDYGRAYCEDSHRFIEKLCETNPELRSTKLYSNRVEFDYPGSGLDFLVEETDQSKIISIKNNVSADLRLLNEIFLKYYLGVQLPEELINLKDQLLYHN